MASIGDRLGDRGPFRTDGRRGSAPVSSAQPRSVAGRVPVHDLEAEAAVLATVFLDETALSKVRPLLPNAAPFYSPAHQRMYEATLAVADRGEPVDLVTVAGELRARGLLAAAGGPEALARIVDATPAVLHVEAHAEIVQRLHRQRTVLARVQQAQAELYDRLADPQAFVEQLARDARALAGEGATSPLRPMSLVELCEDVPPPTFVCPELDLSPGRASQWVGTGGSGKTWAMQSMVLSVTSGLPVFGEWRCAQGTAVHIDFEMGPNPIRRRYRRLAAGMGLDWARDVAPRLRLVSLPRMYLNTPGFEDELARLLDGATICVLDSFRRATPGEEENSSAVGAFVDLLSRVSNRTQTPITFAHHSTTKSPAKGEERSDLAASRGNSAIVDGSGAIFWFVAEAPREPIRVRQTRLGERGLATDEFFLALEDVETTDEHGRIDPRGGIRVAYRCSEQVNPPTSGSKRFDQVKTEILMHVRARPGCNVRYLRGQISAKAALVDEALDQLVQVGVLTHTVGARGAHEYRLGVSR